MGKYQTEIGSVISVSGNSVTIQLSDSVKSNSPIIDGIVYRIGQIGSFLKIPLGYTSLFGIVTKIGAAAIPDNISEAIIKENYDVLANQQWLSITLIGEQVGSRFERGISQSPTTGDIVHIVTLSDLEYVYGGYNEQASINIGNISVSESLNAYLHLNKLISRHFAILGSTGSGKSNAVGVTLNAIIDKKFPRARILLIDPHGEYNSVFGNNSTVFRVNTPKVSERLYIPYWALSFSEFVSLFDGNVNDQNKEYLRTKVLESKINGAKINGIDIDPLIITADSPIPFSLKQLWFDLVDFERQTFLKDRITKTNLTVIGDADKLIANEYPPANAGGGEPFLNPVKKNIGGFLDSICSRLKDTRYDFLFQPGEYTPDLEGKVDKDLSELLISWVGNKKPITILDISNVPSEIMMSVAGTLLNITYEALFWGQESLVGGRKQPLLIVLEEAHNYLRSGENSISSRTVQRIAKEGRKYGVGLLLVTQRPSELDETVLSQCGTIIALRMNNSKDRSYVAAAIQDELRTIVDLLPSLRTGEGIISGEGVSIPSRVQFYKLSHAPKSSDPEVTEEWGKERLLSEDVYKQLVSLWRNKKFKVEGKNNAE